MGPLKPYVRLISWCQDLHIVVETHTGSTVVPSEVDPAVHIRLPRVGVPVPRRCSNQRRGRSATFGEYRLLTKGPDTGPHLRPVCRSTAPLLPQRLQLGQVKTLHGEGCVRIPSGPSGSEINKSDVSLPDLLTSRDPSPYYERLGPPPGPLSSQLP